MRLLTTILFCAFLHINAQENFINNGDFEENVSINNWSYTSNDFNRIFNTWYSPTKTSPDLFGPGFEAPDKWKKLGFGKITPQSGQYYIGFTLYGCDKGKPHCREYLSAPLKSKLLMGTTYVLEFQIAPMIGTTRIDHFGYVFHQDSIHQETFGILDSIEHHKPLKLKPYPYDQWITVKDTFVAGESNLAHITFGNFDNEEDTKVFDKNAALPFAYYYIDNVKLYSLHPPPNKSFFPWLPLEAGKKIVLDKIHFKFDTDILVESSHQQLEDLYGLLLNFPRMKIRIYGHTDAMGSEKYNQLLSQKRADKIYSYLAGKGITEDRLERLGLGENHPIADNITDKGRALNRRVEFEILSLE